jgi:hypothetical protein
VHFAASTPPEEVGFQTAHNVFESAVTMYFEASSFGLGLNDSKTLAPPLSSCTVQSSQRSHAFKDNHDHTNTVTDDNFYHHLQS